MHRPDEAHGGTSYPAVSSSGDYVACCAVIWLTLPVARSKRTRVDLVQIGAGDAHETGAVGIVDGMYGAVLINAGVPWQQAIFLDWL